MRKSFTLLLKLTLFLSLFLSGIILPLPSNVYAATNNNAATNNDSATNNDAKGDYIGKISKGGYSITKKDTKIETDRFIITLPKGIYVPKDIAKDIDHMMNTIESFTKMKFYPKNTIYGKVKIEVLKVNRDEAEFGGAYGFFDGITISPGDLLIDDKGNQFAMTHEFVHCIQFRNYGSMGQICNEGYATYITEQIFNDSSSPYLFDSHTNYSFMEQSITKSNIAKLFANSKIGWNGYLIGFRFMHYLEEELGSGTYLKILKTAHPSSSYEELPLSKVMKSIKSTTSKAILSNFITWYSKNTDKFYDETINFNFTKSKKLNMYPEFAAWNFYTGLRFIYNKKYTIDFTNGFEYLQTYKKYNVKGFYGTIGSTGTATFQFYDINGKRLLSKKLSNVEEQIEVPKAVKIVISGDGEEVTVRPIFESMVEKK